MNTPRQAFKQPISVLVVVHTPALHILLLERVFPPGFWQSITGSVEGNETLAQCAIRELEEETGIRASPSDLVDWHFTNRFPILPEWQSRYEAGVTENTEHVFSLCVSPDQAIRLAVAEHHAYLWLPQKDAATKVASWTNRDAIRSLSLSPIV